MFSLPSFLPSIHILGTHAFAWYSSHFCSLLLNQNGEAPEARETLAIAGDNGLYLSMSSLVRSWFVGLGPTCTTICYCPIYCTPFLMSWPGTYLCIPWLTCSISWLLLLVHVRFSSKIYFTFCPWKLSSVGQSRKGISLP